MNIEFLLENFIKLKIIEIGAGVPLTNSLLKQKDSSKVLIESYCPYGTAKKVFKVPQETRMISKEAVDHILKETLKQDYSKGTLDYNTIFISSFQIPTESYLEKIPHGWICIADLRSDSKYFFHVTMRDINTQSSLKEYFINIYKDISIKLLESIITEESFEELYDIDSFEVISEKVFRDPYEVLSQKEMLLTYTLKDSKVSLVRFEDLTRSYENLIVFKGSFNPFHDGHKEILERTQELYKDSSKSLLMISRDTFGKGLVENLKDRIENLCRLGYDVVIVENPWFFDSLKLIRSRYKGSLKVCMGIDTFSRLYKCYEEGNLSDLEINQCIITKRIITSISEIDNCTNIILKKFLRNFKDFLDLTFIVYDRPCYEFDKEVFKDCEDYVKFLPMNNSISSTELRKES